MVEKDHTQEQTIEYNPEAYVRGEDAVVAAKMLYEYLDGNNYDRMAPIVHSISNILQSRYGDWDADEGMYGSRVTFVDTDGESHTAIVMEPNVSEMTHDRAWDPNREEYVDPEEYPWGTVQLVYTPYYDLSDGFNFDRKDDLKVATSVTPATEPEQCYAYYPGWDYALSDD
jgi:hypothetical protein